MFCNDDKLFHLLDESSKHTSQLCWRMPLFPKYNEMLESSIADLCNISKGRGGGACTAAAFLENFLAKKDAKWAHLDIAGVMDSNKTSGILSKGCTGIPTRALIELTKRIQ